jgi:hypothetical protein
MGTLQMWSSRTVADLLRLNRDGFAPTSLDKSKPSGDRMAYRPQWSVELALDFRAAQFRMVA